MSFALCHLWISHSNLLIELTELLSPIVHLTTWYWQNCFIITTNSGLGVYYLKPENKNKRCQPILKVTNQHLWHAFTFCFYSNRLAADTLSEPVNVMNRYYVDRKLWLPLPAPWVLTPAERFYSGFVFLSLLPSQFGFLCAPQLCFAFIQTFADFYLPQP